MREEADARLNAEIARVREDNERMRNEQQARHDADNTRDAAAQEARRAADQEAAQALESEVARVRAESEAGLLAELERLRKEAAEARRAHEDTQKEIELLREGAEIEARAQAEQAAARALESEVARVKAEADARLNEELGRVRAEAEQSKRQHEQSQRNNDSVAEEVRRQAEEAAARALESEVARVRAEANARLEEELSLVRAEAEVVREGLEQEKREAELLRQRQAQEFRAEQEAARLFEAEAGRLRAEADVKLKQETERARQEANVRLEAEVAAAKADAEQRRAAELEEVRAQVLRLRTAAAEQARAAAEQAVAAEVARAKALTPVTPQPRAEIATQWESDAFVTDDLRRQRSSRRVPSRKKAWILAAAASLVLVVSSVFAFGVLPMGKSSKEAPSGEATRATDVPPDAPATSGPTGELRIESTPDGARVMLDGRESGFTPLTLNNVPAGRHLLVIEGENGTVRRTVRVQAGERTIARYEITGGFIAISSKFPVEIYQGKKKIGLSSEGHLSLPPGRHKITLVNGRFNYRADVELTVKAGEITSHTVELPLGSLIVNTAAGAEIFVDGERMGSAPLAAFPAAVGVREVLVRHIDFGERRQSVEVTPGKPIELSVLFEGATPGPRQPPKLAPLSRAPERRR